MDERIFYLWYNMRMSKDYPRLLIGGKNKKIYDIARVEATGMKAGIFFRLKRDELIKLPSASSLFVLPQRSPIGYDRDSARFISMDSNPFCAKVERSFAVAAFLPPGYTLTYNSAYRENKGARVLPLFAYAAVAFFKGELYTPATRIDRESRQDERCMNVGEIKRGIKRLRIEFRKNRLFRHLENCALVNNCPAAKNLFLNRYEAPLPTSPHCNADCLGCISYQPDKLVPITQPRIKFFPTPQEIAEVAIYHIQNTKDPVVSFGQGCEGEPLLAAEIIEKALKLIRGRTSKGVINLNTNASKPAILSRLFDAGLDSVRVSLNSCQEIFYNRYYRPRGYKFVDVLKSIKIAKDKDIFVSLNYLVNPGFSDSRQEFQEFKRLLSDYKIDMIQWRNLNFDPQAYCRLLKFSPQADSMLGIGEIISLIKKGFPDCMMGYFNPSRQRINRFKASLK